MKLESTATILDFSPYDTRTEAEATHNLGEKVESADRTFRYCRAGEALTIGYLAVQEDIATELTMAVLAGAVGAQSITFTNAANVTVAGEYDEGYAMISYGTGIGQTWKIKNIYITASGVKALASGSASTVEIDGPIGTALDTTSKLDLVKNLYADVNMTATATLIPAGVPLVAVGSGDYGWLQTRGVCGVFSHATIAAGVPVAPDETTPGAVEAMTEAGQILWSEIGKAFWHPAAASYSHPVFLLID